MSDVITVSEYCDLVNSNLAGLKAKVIGEVTEFKEWQISGHAYFSLKDEKDQSILGCAMWKSNYVLSGIRLENGMQVIATGVPNIYKKSGRLSFIINTLELVGEGALKKRYDELKLKLTREGFFAEERKRQIPKFIHNIGVITSIRGAVIHDFQNNLGRHGFNIKFMDSLVEGQEATRDLLASIKTMRKQEIDVLVIMRGGGSLQSLAAFDNEVLVREIVNFPVPVIAGIGHHQDVPLLALAADLSLSTPTATANFINQPWVSVIRDIDNFKYEIFTKFQKILSLRSTSIEGIKDIIINSFNKINLMFKKVENMIPVNLRRLEDTIFNNSRLLAQIKVNLVYKYKEILKSNITNIQNLEKRINLNNPYRLLNLGYSIALMNNKVLKSVRNAIIGENLEILLSDGQLNTKIINKNDKK